MAATLAEAATANGPASSADAAEQVKQIVRLLKDAHFEDAAELASQVLEAQCTKHGEMATECARSYYLYGVSLLEKARCDSDVFGDQVQDAAKAKTEALIQEAMAEPGPADEGEEDEDDSEGVDSEEESDEEEDDAAADEASAAEPSAAPAKTGSVITDQAAAPLPADGTAAPPARDPAEPAETSALAQPQPPAEAAAGVKAESAGGEVKAEAAEAGVKAEAQSGAAAAEPEEEEDEDDEGEDAGDDMQLAWEMLEIARKIYSAAQPVDASGLADAHMRLGDVALEQANFDSAVNDYKQALQYLGQCDQASSRMAAELHFKLSQSQQLQDNHKAALAEAQQAIKLLEALIKQLQPEQPAAAAGQMFGVPDTSATASAPAQSLATEVQAEVSELQAVLDELWDRVDELKEGAAKSDAEYSSIAWVRDEVKAAMGSLGGAEADQEDKPAGITFGSKPAEPAAVPKPEGQENISGASNGNGVQDLGVVGRGRKRVTPTAVSAASPDGESAPAKRAKLETETFKAASDPLRNTVQPEAPEQTTNEALAKAAEPTAAV